MTEWLKNKHLWLAEITLYINFFSSDLLSNCHFLIARMYEGCAQMVKNLPAMWETYIWCLGQGRNPGEGNGYALRYSWLENSIDKGAWQATVHGVTESETTWVTNTFTFKGAEAFRSAFFTEVSPEPKINPGTWWNVFWLSESMCMKHSARSGIKQRRHAWVSWHTIYFPIPYLSIPIPFPGGKAPNSVLHLLPCMVPGT